MATRRVTERLTASRQPLLAHRADDDALHQAERRRWQRFSRDALTAFREIERAAAAAISGLTTLAPLLDTLTTGYFDLTPLERKRLRGKARYLRAYRRRGKPDGKPDAAPTGPNRHQSAGS